MRKIIDGMVGKRFGRLTVKGLSKRSESGHTYWVCKCKCGKIVEVLGSSLRNENTKSCGCLQDKCNTNGDRNPNSKYYPLFWSWKCMKRRCNDPKDGHYVGYGGRGITVCREWDESYQCFKKWAIKTGWNSKLTIDRIDNDGNYEPDNCRWSTSKQQAGNRRNNRWLEYGGRRMILSDWARELGVHHSSLQRRLSNGQVFEFIVEKYLIGKMRKEDRNGKSNYRNRI
jgi:hypothetical protein